MKIKVEIVDSLKESEVILRSAFMDETTKELTKVITDFINKEKNITFYKEDSAYYVSLQDILFFETDGNTINAHSMKEVYHTKYKLYELEDILPGYFMRISKSAIVNTKKIYALTSSLRSCVISFKDTHKQVYVSRHYYQSLKERLEKR